MQLEEHIVQQLPDSQQEKTRSYLASAANVSKGALGTVGSGLKGVGDTAGNTVGALVGGLGKTAGDVYEGAKSTTGYGEKEESGVSLDDVAKAGQKNEADVRETGGEHKDDQVPDIEDSSPL